MSRTGDFHAGHAQAANWDRTVPLTDPPDAHMDALVDKYRNKYSGGRPQPREAVYDDLKTHVAEIGPNHNSEGGRRILMHAHGPLDEYHDYTHLLAHYVAGNDPARRAAVPSSMRFKKGTYANMYETHAVNPAGEKIRIQVVHHDD